MTPGDRSVPWASALPPALKTRPIKYVVNFNPEALPEDTDPELLIRYVDISNVDSEGRIGNPEELRFGQAPSRARRVARIGDVIVSTVRTYLTAISRIPADGITVSTGFAVLRPRATVDSRFLGYWMRSSYVIDEIVARSTGVSYPAINPSEIGQLPVPTIDIDEQKGIADFLDAEIAQIDLLASAKENLITLLSEKRKGIVSRGVIRGLATRAPLRQSGITWLREMPAHWATKRAKWLFRERDQRSTTGEEVLLSLRMDRGLVRHNDISEKKSRPEELIGYKRVSAGELVVNRMRAATGLIAVAPEDGLVSPDYAVFCPLPEVCAEYFAELFRTELLQSVFRSRSKGLGTGSSGFLRLYSQEFLSIWLPYPTYSEQLDIVDGLRSETAEIDDLAIKARRSLDLLNEYRSALITATVTRQIDVRTYRTQEAVAEISA